MSASFADWRARVEKDLAGAAFDKVLVHTTAEGIRVEPLYVEAPQLDPSPRSTTPVMLCVVAEGVDVDEELSGGADAFWIRDRAALDRILARDTKSFLLVDAALADPALSKRAFALTADPLGDTSQLVALAKRFPDARTVLVSSLRYHDAGADAADEISILLSTVATYLRGVTNAGLDLTALDQITLQIPIGRDTFAELCKVRALRVCWSKLVASTGRSPVPAFVHAISSARTHSERDPWVNMLRVTTQTFAAILGGADLVTPAAFDGGGSALGRRIARNTLLVLREESQLGRVIDPAHGSYYLDSFTDALAREAWRRFRTLEGEGGIAAALESGSLSKQLAASWEKRRIKLDTRKEPIVGVSEFANLDEERLPRRTQISTSSFPQHRDAEEIEALRDRADTMPSPTVELVTLGPPAEHHARVGFAQSFFAIGGLRAAKETSAPIACICGSDERYAAEAVDTARALKARGAKRVLLAGRPGALEAALRAAGVDDFIYIGCDAVRVLAAVMS